MVRFRQASRDDEGDEESTRQRQRTLGPMPHAAPYRPVSHLSGALVLFLRADRSHDGAPELQRLNRL